MRGKCRVIPESDPQTNQKHEIYFIWPNTRIKSQLYENRLSSKCLKKKFPERTRLFNPSRDLMKNEANVRKAFMIPIISSQHRFPSRTSVPF